MARKRLSKTLRNNAKQSRSSAKPFLDLSDTSIYKKLTKKQKFYVEEYNKMFGADLLAQTQDYYDMLPKEIQRAVRYTQQKVLSGRSYREAQSTYLENYAIGLENSGRKDLADFLRNITKSKRGQLQRQSLIDNLVNLNLYYGRSEEAQSKISSLQISDALAQSATSMIEYAIESGINVIDKGMSIESIRELMDTGYIEYDIIYDIREQELSRNHINRDTLNKLNEILGLEEDNEEEY